MSQRRFLVGTNTTQRAARGLYLCATDGAGRIDIVDVCDMPDPSFVVLHPVLPIAYAVNEMPTGHGAVSVVAIGDRLEVRQRVDSEGELPCHLALVNGARTLAVAHYGCGTIGLFEVDARGTLGAPARTWRHVGASLHPRRQASAHPHYVLVSATGNLYVTDLGQDLVVCYDTETFVEKSRCAVHAGAGPRHLCLDPANGVGWLSNELDNTVSRLAIERDGSLREVEWISSLPADFTGRSAVSEIARHPNGRWLYVGNRGHDSIAWYSIGAAGRLMFEGAMPTGGRHPRHFALTADGAAMLVANRDSDHLVPFRIESDGRPERLATPFATPFAKPFAKPFAGVPAPACICWL